ncbi:MAG: hypothetical protein FD163_950 [Hyphomonadaceae bacterium]|nr:MAG: hypothetical protein FD128_1351 [Hyphomonadaceae bacterium]KAF0186282.1 MAG: hypothetical protein FD163_950 [Hyphomonadaceae bacterium]
METRANFILIGAFTILSLLVAAVFTVWIANTGFDKNYVSYDVVFQGPVRGLELGGEVKFNGIKVGEISDLSLDKNNPENVIARIKVESSTPVNSGSLAQLEPAGLTGLSYIQILTGDPKTQPANQKIGPLLRKKGEDRPRIPTQRSQMDRLLQGGEGVVATTYETLTRVNQVLSDTNIRSFTSIMDNIQRASAQITQQGQLLDRANLAALTVGQAGTEVAKLAQGANAAASTYNELGQNLLVQTRDISQRTNNVLDASNTLVRDLNTTARTANTTLASIDGAATALQAASGDFRQAAVSVSGAATSVDVFFAQGTYETLPKLNNAVQNIADVSDSANRFMQDASASPVGLLSRPTAATVKWKK